MTERPYAVPDRDSRPFWEAAAKGALLLQRCGSCEEHIFYPRSVCPHCMASDPEWVRSSGRGTVYSFTVAHRPAAGFEGQEPYAVALVELEEGVRIMGRLEAESPAVGMAVIAAFAEAPGGLHVPYFLEERG